jgi:hypothetical protein
MKSQASPWPGEIHRAVLDISINDLLDWIKDTFTPSYRKEVESYLADSTDIFDLERRIQILQRRGIV